MKTFQAQIRGWKLHISMKNVNSLSYMHHIRNQIEYQLKIRLVNKNFNAFQISKLKKDRKRIRIHSLTTYFPSFKNSINQFLESLLQLKSQLSKGAQAKQTNKGGCSWPSRTVRYGQSEHGWLANYHFLFHRINTVFWEHCASARPSLKQSRSNP